MITITRRQARRLRAVFRRHALGLNPKANVPPLVLIADRNAGLRVRFQAADLAVEYLFPGQPVAAAAVALPLDALTDLEGKDDSPVVLENTPGHTIVRWQDRGVPRARDHVVPPIVDLPSFPAMPTSFESCSGELLAALAEAHATTDEDNSRYALGLIQLRGDAGEVVATDGHQLLVQGGFRFPWRGDALFRGLPLFATKELPRDRPIEVGRTDAHVVLRTESLAIALGLHPDARFPRVDQVLPNESSAATRLRLDPGDRAFLARSLDGLPGGEAEHAPITLDLNGRIGVRARDPVGERTTELVLARSRYDGPPVRVAMDRRFLLRALHLGMGDLQITGPDQPLAVREGKRSYGWQPMGVESALGPDSDGVRVESTSSAESTATAVNFSPVPAIVGQDASRAVRVHAREERPGDGGLSSVIQEARELRDALGQAQSRAGRLVAALRKQKAKGRLVQETLRSLRQLRLQDVAG